MDAAELRDQARRARRLAQEMGHRIAQALVEYAELLEDRANALEPLRFPARFEVSPRCPVMSRHRRRRPWRPRHTPRARRSF
jgi:hypothetical protein